MARFLSTAEAELFDAAAYYEIQVSGLGQNFLEIVESAVAEIDKNPTMWPELEQSVRRRVVRRFPYSILYVLDGSEPVIVAIMHHKQRPRYWMERL